MSDNGVSFDPATGNIFATGNITGASINVPDVTMLRAGGKPVIEQVFTGATDMIPTSDAINTRLSSVLNGVNQLPELSDLTPKYIGTMFFLKESQYGYLPGHFYEVISGDSGLEYRDFAYVKSIPLGTVTGIRFSFIDGVLNVYWRDPDNVFIDGAEAARFGFTRLIAKIGSYPEGPNDGQILIDSSVKNQYLDNPATFNLDKNETWYCRFFPCTDTGVWSGETAYPTDNRFTTSSYSWNKIYEYLEDYSKYHLALPAEGDTFYLDYIINDYWLEGSTKVAANTRQLVMDNLDKLSATALPWRVLGYNANVPQYVKYRCKLQNDRGKSTTNPLTQVVTIGGTVITDAAKNDVVWYHEAETYAYERFIYTGTLWVSYDAWSEYDYKWVSSADDKTESFEFFDEDGNSLGRRDVPVGIDSEYGTGWQRQISAGCRVYSMSYDAATGRKTYEDAVVGSRKLTVSSIDTNVFAYDNNGVGKSNAYTVPVALSVSDGASSAVSAYVFCGYTMTVQPQNCLNGATNTSHYNNIQFDAAENTYALPWNNYPTTAGTGPDYGYYWKDSLGFHAIDLSRHVELLGNNTQEFNGHDVWKLHPNGEILVDSCFFENNHKYAKKTGDTTYVRQDLIIPFQKNTVYYATNSNKNYSGDKAWNGNVVNDYVGRFDGDGNLTAIYKCIKQTTATYDKFPEEDASSFTLDTTILASGNYVVVGQKIPVNQNIYEVNIADSGNGSNLYATSFFRSYVNNLDGAQDHQYLPQTRFDVVSTGGLRNVNGPFLKLSKEQDFLSHLIPCVNITVLSPYRRQFRRAKSLSGSWVEHTTDMFWPLANYEVFGSGVDGSCVFDKVLGTNEKRIKQYLNQSGGLAGAAYWWLRYPNTGDSYTEYHVTTSGASFSYTACYSLGCVPACILG